MTTYIILGTGSTQVKLYLDKEVPVSLNYSVAEIQDIARKNAAYSKQFAIPSTPSNDKAFGHYWNINIDSSFDINVRNTAMVVCDDMVVMRGYMQLNGVKKISPNDITGEQSAYYQVTIFDDTLGFIESLQEEYLHQMDMSRYDHTLDFGTIYQSMSYTWQSGFTYPLLYRNYLSTATTSAHYFYTDFKPAIFAKTYLTQMFEDAGYNYTSDFLDSTNFESLAIPYNGARDAITGDTSSLLFEAALSNDATFGTLRDAQDHVQVIYNAGYTPGTTRLQPVVFDTDISDPLNSYDTSSGVNVAQWNGEDTLTASFHLHYGLFNPTAPGQGADGYPAYLYGEAFDGSDLSTEIADSYINVTLTVYIGSTTASGTITEADLIPGKFTKYVYNLGQQLYRAQGTGLAYSLPENTYQNVGTYTVSGITHVYTNTDQQAIGEKQGVWATMTYSLPGNNMWWRERFFSGSGGIDYSILASGGDIVFWPTLRLRFGYEAAGGPSVNNSFANSGVDSLVEYGTVTMNQFIPRNVKKKDFFSWLCQMHNLYVRVNPTNSRNLIIQTRDEFYDSGTDRDWSSKIAIEQDMDVKFLTEIQNTKTLDFTWQEDSDDALLTMYKQENNLTYGEYTIDFDNQFLKGTRQVKPGFTMTPTVLNAFDVPVPYIVGEDPHSTLRILYKKPTLRTGFWRYQRLNGLTWQIINRTDYGWCGEFDDPVTPTLSLNWGDNQDIYYPTLSVFPYDNLYNTYYANTVRALSTERMLAASFYLTAIDIAQLQLNDKIWIDQSKAWFVVNKIENFNPVDPGLTKVELIRFNR